MRNNTRSLVVQGMAAARAGEVEEARFCLEWALRRNPPIHERADALYWLSEIASDPAEQREYLEAMLARDLGDARARRKLAILDGLIDPAEMINPDKFVHPAPAGAPQASDAERFTCPQCGGRMAYTPDGQSLTCEYCASRQQLGQQPQAEGDAGEENFIAALATARGHLHPVDMQLFTCQGCGAGFILPPEQLSTSCPYCNSTHVVKGAEAQQILEPNGLIPFKVSSRQARIALKNWFSEAGLEPFPRVARRRGFYIPAWTFDIGGQLSWSCLVWKNDDWQPLSAPHVVYQDDVLLLASQQLPAALRHAAESFDLDGLEPYDRRYLADWPAETYQLPVSDASLKARKIALEVERDIINAGLPLRTRDLRISSANMLVESYRLILLPVWLTHYRIDEQHYHVLINGQSGEVFGERPRTGVRKWLHRLLGED